MFIPLVAPSKIKSLAYVKPLHEREDGLKVYLEPKENHFYFMGVDVSRGQEIDYHAITIVDMTESPYKVVAQYKNNELALVSLAKHDLRYGKGYNNANVLVEINDIGQEITDILHNDMEYENILTTSIRGRKGQVMDGGYGQFATQMGVRMSPKVKRGCAMLKELIESDKLMIEDYDIINELASFVSKRIIRGGNRTPR